MNIFILEQNKRRLIKIAVSNMTAIKRSGHRANIITYIKLCELFWTVVNNPDYIATSALNIVD